MIVLGIDPGTERSAWCFYDAEAHRVLGSDIQRNDDVRLVIKASRGVASCKALVVEMVQCYGMPVGKEVFETCVWIGRFLESARCYSDRVTRPQCALHLCGTHRAKDGSMNQALKDKLGGKGTKKAPGPLYGVKSHIWSALAVAVTWVETQGDQGMLPAKEKRSCESDSLLSSASALPS